MLKTLKSDFAVALDRIIFQTFPAFISNWTLAIDMAKDLIRYDLLVQDAFRGLFRRVLTDAAAHGLPGDHHFYITFRTHAPGVELSDLLRSQYPEQMTIILQHQFWNLKVGENGFEVSLSFKRIPERLVVPFSAVTAFFDPSVNFGTEFTLETSEAETDAAPAPAAPTLTLASSEERPQVKAAKAPSAPLPPAHPAARLEESAPALKPVADAQKTEPQKSEPQKVISIDTFRKKNT